MNPCKEWEPTVIDNILILECIQKQIPKGELGKLIQEEGLPAEEVQQISFEYKNILRIDHLWVLKSLKKLCVNNNLIDKIENLHSLKNLEELDLSFNKISKIENLDSLFNLRKLNLFENLITHVENLENLTKLTVLSLGRNKIDDTENIIYLRKLKSLKSLNLAGNPVAEEENFRYFISIFLPNLIYYEYKLISDKEKSTGSQIFSEQLAKLLEVESKELAIKEKEEKEKADAELHSISFVEYLNSNHLFLQMFEGDEEGKTLLLMGQEVEEFYDEFQEQFVDLCKRIFSIGQEQYIVRKNEVDAFMYTVEKAKSDNQEKGINIMELFLQQKTSILERLNKLLVDDDTSNDISVTSSLEIQTNEELDEIAITYNNMLHDLWKKLMRLEIDLFEQMEDINQTFEHTLNDMVNNFIEEAQGLFSQIRSLENTYTENVMDCANRLMTNINVDDKFEVPEALRNILSDKEIFNNTIGTSHDLHLLIIDNREDILINRARQWHANLIGNLNKSEIERNRSKVLEISHFLDVQRQEFANILDT